MWIENLFTWQGFEHFQRPLCAHKADKTVNGVATTLGITANTQKKWLTITTTTATTTTVAARNANTIIKIN